MGRKDLDLLVIGGGAAGLTAAGLGASLGARTLLVESDRLGGDCTWSGCVPSKALLSVAHDVHRLSRELKPGVSVNGVELDTAQILEHVRSVRERIYQESDSPEVLSEFGVETLSGTARFVDAERVEVATRDGMVELSSRYIVVATGSVLKKPEIPGLASGDLLGSGDLFEMKELPESMLVVGAGAVGLELAQALSRLGVSVTVVSRGDRGRGSFELETSQMLIDILEREGVDFHFHTEIVAGERRRDGSFSVSFRSEGGTRQVSVSQILAATGSEPRVQGLDLESAGVKFDGDGIAINQSCQTSQSNIYAAGDVAKGPNFTHVAEEMSKTAIKRILLKMPSSWERELVPRVLYTSPEVASIGEGEESLNARKAQYKTIRYPFSKIDRARILSREDGLILIHYAPLSGKIVGAHIVGEHAGEMIHEFALAMKHGLTLRDISSTMHAYPTYAQGIRRAADQIYVQTGSPTPLKFLGSLFGYRGEVSEKIGGEDVV